MDRVSRLRKMVSFLAVLTSVAGAATFVACGQQSENEGLDTQRDALLWSADCGPDWAWLEGEQAWVNKLYPGAVGIINVGDTLNIEVLVDNPWGWKMLSSAVYFSGSQTPAAEHDFSAAPVPLEGQLKYQDDYFFSLSELGAGCGEMIDFAVKVTVQRETETGVEVAVAWSRNKVSTSFLSYQVCCAPQGCTLTQGYWKNHAEEWPVESLTIGGISYTQNELLQLLQTPPRRGNASLVLAHQLIAARLNVANGARPTADIQTALAEAEAWMVANYAGTLLPYSVSIASPAGAEAVRLAELLTAFNQGEAGVGHCDDSATP